LTAISIIFTLFLHIYEISNLSLGIYEKQLRNLTLAYRILYFVLADNNYADYADRDMPSEVHQAGLTPADHPSWPGGVAEAVRRRREATITPKAGWWFMFEKCFSELEPPPRRFAPPLLARRGDRWLLIL
jgi:hypothetical protein